MLCHLIPKTGLRYRILKVLIILVSLLQLFYILGRGQYILHHILFLFIYFLALWRLLFLCLYWHHQQVEVFCLHLVEIIVILHVLVQNLLEFKEIFLF